MEKKYIIKPVAGSAHQSNSDFTNQNKANDLQA